MRKLSPFVFLLSCSACSGDKTADPSPADASVARDVELFADAETFPDAETFADAEPTDLGTPDAGTATVARTFTGDVFPIIFEAGCSRVGCHGSLRSWGGRSAYMPSARDAYLDILNRTSIGDDRYVVVKPGDPMGSTLYTWSRDEYLDRRLITESELDIFKEWIIGGAVYGPEVAEPTPPVPDTCSMVELIGDPSLPDACMPRCTQATFDAVTECLMGPDPLDCRDAAVAADTATVAYIDYGPEIGMLDLDCGGCLAVQQETCLVEFCQAEYLAYLRCEYSIPGAPPCDEEVDAVVACLDASPDFAACANERRRKCYPE